MVSHPHVIFETVDKFFGALLSVLEKRSGASGKGPKVKTSQKFRPDRTLQRGLAWFCYKCWKYNIAEWLIAQLRPTQAAIGSPLLTSQPMHASKIARGTARSPFE
jgi:hypothetical protein